MGDVAAGFVAAFALSAALGGPLVGWLRAAGARQTVSGDAPARHAGKQGTPTMGGALILAGLTFAVVGDALLDSEHATALSLLALTIGFGLIGFVDDLLIARRGKNLGITARQKLALQFALAGLFVYWLAANAVPERTTVLRVGPGLDVDLGAWYYVLAALLIVGMSNAINLADGLDGLAGGMAAVIALALAATVHAVAGYGWLPLFAGALAGGCAGFLWYNAHPARVFMGNTGSTALGAALAGIALMGKVEVPFQFYAIVPWAVLFSVVVQVSVFKYRRRRYGLDYARTHRVFRRTPLHHHFEELGWPETRIVARFWLMTGAAVAATLALTARL